MNICYTYWTNELENICCGFSFPQFFFEAAEKSLKLASVQNLVDNIVIYTDEDGAEILKSNLPKINKLSYVIVDYSKYDFDKRFWNFPKLITYNLQKETFLHIDFDVFLKPEFSDSLDFSSDIFTEMLRDYEHKPEFDIFDKDGKKPEYLICSGLIGGSNLQLFKDNFKIALDFCKPTKRELNFFDLVAIEEYCFTKLAISRGLTAQSFDKSTYSHFQGKCKHTKYSEIINNY